MSNYTTQTAALKAVTIDTAKIDAKQIDTKKLFINGELFDPSQIKESPNQIFTLLIVLADSTGNHFFGFMSENDGTIVTGICQNNKIQVDAFELLSYFYPNRNISQEGLPLLNLMEANFCILHIDEQEGYANPEKCILDVQTELIDGIMMLSIKLGEEDDNLLELYGGGIDGEFLFYMSIPYATPPSQTSTFSLRQPQISPLSLEQAQQVFTNFKQQMLDKSAE
jgi:hypothetical protein